MAIKSRLARMAGPLVIQWRRPSSVVALPITLALMSVAAAADTLTLDVLLDRATAYELAFIQQLSNVVAEEQYVQETLAVSLMRTGPAASQLKRVLLSGCDKMAGLPPGARSRRQIGTGHRR